MDNRVYVSASHDPFYNLAVEEELFYAQGAGATLYLWQNQNTVVIGKNQNALAECRVALLESEGGRLARRSSGGGAVFHDLGNLNFTFLLPQQDYDLPRQLSVIQRACASFGIGAVLSGRNDVVLENTGAKFSGNAFRFSSGRALHHGTILISADLDKLSRYLAPPAHKYQSKGVASVRARVSNLCECNPAVTIENMRYALADAFSSVYGPAEKMPLAALDSESLARRTDRYASDEFRFGCKPDFDVSLAAQLSFGRVELLLRLSGVKITGATVYSDAMNADLADALSAALTGSAYNAAEMAKRVLVAPLPEAEELADFLAAQEL